MSLHNSLCDSTQDGARARLPLSPESRSGLGADRIDHVLTMFGPFDARHASSAVNCGHTVTLCCTIATHSLTLLMASGLSFHSTHSHITLHQHLSTPSRPHSSSCSGTRVSRYRPHTPRMHLPGAAALPSSHRDGVIFAMLDTDDGDERRMDQSRPLLSVDSDSHSLSLSLCSSPTSHSPPPAPVPVSFHVPLGRHVQSAYQAPLLDVAVGVRSLMWQYMDNRTIVEYLSTCRQLNTLYHSVPLTEPVTVKQQQAINRLHQSPASHVLLVYMFIWWVQCVPLLNVCVFVILPASKPAGVIVLALLGFGMLVVLAKLIRPLLLPARTPCRDDGGRLSRFRRAVPTPRVIRSTGSCGPADLPYLQHLEEARVYDHQAAPIHKCKLPTSLRSMMLYLHDYSLLKPNTLPPQLTTLVVTNLADIELPLGVLPPSLVTLAVSSAKSIRVATDPRVLISPIAAGVLPAQLQRLVIEWKGRSLVDLSLPTSLVALDIWSVADLPLPAGSLPPTLRRLWIKTGEFHPRNFVGALPASLRVLRLHCFLTQPLTSDLLAMVPQLSELDLGVHDIHRLTAGTLAPLTQLRLLRLGCLHRHQVTAGVLPPSLRRLVVAAESSEKVDELLPVAVRHAGLVVEWVSKNAFIDFANIDELLREGYLSSVVTDCGE